jgi:hypothetical protein
MPDGTMTIAKSRPKYDLDHAAAITEAMTAAEKRAALKKGARHLTELAAVEKAHAKKKPRE